ncbi:LysR family transcriptional regulator [Pseudoalteromonas umbrosa]|uniref:LysR family transcriptional regulator n=1 Tax=Pseudoalteromonas umbrosa TaxID=3048489 RepID=UPI0024C41C71|nr:LysR family transcriptional regulator [Pseudoalteromonas sp. B95]MDK1288652.1 LysR family transcriptional regulator [Pseudoalteromonas sp. B95]
MSFTDVPWRNIDLNLLVAFAYLYRYQSVSIAAEKSYVSQSAMSHSLSRLRALFNDVLFERKGHKMMATERAHQLAPTVNKLLDCVSNDLLTSAPFDPADYDGICRIGLTDYAEFIFAPTIFDAIRLQAPKAQVSFVNVNRSNYLALAEQEKLDIVIGSITAPDPAFQSQHLYTESHVCIADPHCIAFEQGLSKYDFANIEHALVSPDGRLATGVDDTLQAEGLNRKVTVATRNFMTIQSLLKGRKLIAIVPKKMADVACEQSLLRYFDPPIRVPDFDISILWFQRKNSDDKSIWLRSLLISLMAQQ